LSIFLVCCISITRHDARDGSASARAGLIDRASTRARFKLTPLGRDVRAALLRPPVNEQDG